MATHVNAELPPRLLQGWKRDAAIEHQVEDVYLSGLHGYLPPLTLFGAGLGASRSALYFGIMTTPWRL